MRPALRGDRAPILYLAPWVDYGGTDKGTIDWFRWLDRDRYAPSLITTQQSKNRRLREVTPYADEVWVLPELMAGVDMPGFVFDFIHSRGVEVLHVMNSRLGFDLLPDLASLPRPPRVVAQLHVEEPDRSGYVRYVTSRYGNLVDAFSVTSDDLADRVYGYGISRDRIHVIHTGVDAEEEFSPKRARPIAGLEPDRAHILFPGRLVNQKDPLLMLEVAAVLRERDPAFQVHAVGDGDLEPELRRRIDELDLARHVSIHPPTAELNRWYAACDLLLLTSLFEGAPYVVYEAMAMGLPIVAPALPGIIEILRGVAGGLVEPRDDVAAYVEAIGRLLDDPARRRELGERARAGARERFSLRSMADEHAALYDRLIGPRPRAGGDDSAPEPLRFRGRRLHETPLVSVIIPCYDQGRWLRECLDAVAAQTYGAVETIVVDDGSTERETIGVLDELASGDRVEVVRLAENGGPSRARNVGLERARGRYLLPVDADNVILPEAIERLVSQLKVAGEEVGFIYPNVQFFGNRDDYFEAPEWNLHELLIQNWCDVCSLFDREIFDAGLRFDEGVRLGHEDWEFILRLAARGVRGEPARFPTFRYRKIGFNRSDSVEYAQAAFRDAMPIRSQLLAFEAEIKSRSSPALSLIALEPIDAGGEAGRRLASRFARQSCIDVELIARYDGAWQAPAPEPPTIAIPTALADCAARALVDAWPIARAPIVAVTSGTGSCLLDDPGFIEKLLRIFDAGDRFGQPLGALALVDTGDENALPLQVVNGDRALGPPHTVVIPATTEGGLAAPLALDRHAPLDSLLTACVPATSRRVEVRHLSGGAEDGRDPLGRRGDTVELSERTVRRHPHEARPKERQHPPPLLPSLPTGVRRWQASGGWTPPQTVVVCRHRHLLSEDRIVTNSAIPPAGYLLEHHLGFARNSSLAGTVRLRALADGRYAVGGAERSSEAPGSRDLGWAETAPLPGFVALILARHRDTGQHALVTGQGDPQASLFEPIEPIGFLEPFVTWPSGPPHGRSALGLVGLVRAVDVGARRHRYALGAIPDGEVPVELGALLVDQPPDGVPVWVVDGWLVTRERRPAAARPRLRTAARWALAPLAWRGLGMRKSRAVAVIRRSREALVRVALGRRRPGPPPSGAPAGWLEGQPRKGSPGLWCAYHPVTGDQLLAQSPDELTDMGYRDPALLGFLRAMAPITGDLAPRVVPVPWASRFGLTARRG